MTDRIDSFVVILEKDIREDDIQDTMMAICMVKGVLKAVPQIRDGSYVVIKERIKSQLLYKLFEMVKEM